MGNYQKRREGNSLALGSMPRFILMVDLPGVIRHLCACSLITNQTLLWAEARKNALASLAAVCTTVGVVTTDNPAGLFIP